MEVILKKTKISKSVMDQTTYSYNGMMLGKVLGWCRIKGSAWIAIYHESEKILTKIRLYSNFEKEDDFEGFYIKIDGNRKGYRSAEERDLFYNNYKQVKEKALEAGQFYL